MVQSVVFYKQSLVDTMKIDVGSEISDSPHIHTLSQKIASDNRISNTTHTQFLHTVSNREDDSSAEPDGEAQPKSSVSRGRDMLMSKKALITTPCNS